MLKSFSSLFISLKKTDLISKMLDGLNILLQLLEVLFEAEQVLS